MDYCFDRFVELQWTVMGDRLPQDHGYRLYAALVSQAPQLKQIDYRMSLVSGTPDRGGWLKLGRQSRLMVRCHLDHLQLFSNLDRQVIRIGQNLVQLGDCEGSSIEAKESLSADFVTIKSSGDSRAESFSFGVSLGKQLQMLGVDRVPTLGNRKTLKIKDTTAIGFGLHFPVLSPEESIALQAIGLGGRGKLGCGFFYSSSSGVYAPDY